MKAVPDGNDFFRNPSREDKLYTKYPSRKNGATVAASYRMDTTYDVAAMAKFKDYLNTYIKANGYTGMEDAIADFWSENQLSQMKDEPYDTAGVHPSLGVRIK
jgi:hypothetical protein